MMSVDNFGRICELESESIAELEESYVMHVIRILTGMHV